MIKNIEKSQLPQEKLIESAVPTSAVVTGIVRSTAASLQKVGLILSDIDSNGECKAFVERFRYYYTSPRTAEIISKKLADAAAI